MVARSGGARPKAESVGGAGSKHASAACMQVLITAPTGSPQVQARSASAARQARRRARRLARRRPPRRPSRRHESPHPHSRLHASAHHGAHSPQARELAPSLDQIKLPDKYRMLPVPKIEMLGAPQDPTVVQLSRPHRAPQITLRENEQGVALSAVGYKGYRMVRATHGVSSGCYYYEVLVQEPLHGEDGHMRIGWSTEAGDLQAPVGYDVN
jgi:hypothetical protein